MSPQVLMTLRLIDGVQHCPELGFRYSRLGMVLDMSRVQSHSPVVCGPSQRIAICCEVDLSLIHIFNTAEQYEIYKHYTTQPVSYTHLDVYKRQLIYTLF